MSNRKPLRTRGKVQLSRYFQKFEKDDAVAVTREMSERANFPKRIQGRTGRIEGRVGKSYVVKLKDQDKEKRFIIPAIHLRKIK